jgi:hypothetical protein
VRRDVFMMEAEVELELEEEAAPWCCGVPRVCP